MWLVVTGKGSWNYGGKPYRPGVYEVDQATADAAIASRMKALFVTDFEPEIMRTPDSGSPLSLDDIKVGTNRGGVQLHEDPTEEAEPDGSGRVFDFPCTYCPKKMMSSGSLARHIEFHHELVPTA